MSKKINKVIYNGSTLIDLTSDTVTAGNLVSGITAHGADGESITGTITTYNWEWTVRHDTNPMTSTEATDAGFSWR